MSEGREERGPTMSRHGVLVAVIDDDAAVCDSTHFLLETYDFGVRTYLTATDFLKDDPDIACLIVDYQLPGLNGLGLVSELRTRGRQVSNGVRPNSASSKFCKSPCRITCCCGPFAKSSSKTDCVAIARRSLGYDRGVRRGVPS